MRNNKKSFLRFMQERIDFYESIGMKTRAGRLRVAQRKMFRFAGGKDLSFDELTRGTMERWEAWLKQQGVCRNTVSYYNRLLRAVYNAAVDEGLTADKAPFKKCYTGNEKTVKRAIPISKVKQIAHIELGGVNRISNLLATCSCYLFIHAA